MSEPVDCVVIGAGVVGLAVARALAMAGREVIIVEKEAGIGTGVSSRNSEVIHAGLYYPPGSLKATLCVRGRDLLYAYCGERDIAHRRCGKLVVATHAAQLETLDSIANNARANGVPDLRQITGEDAMRMEPALRCVGALWSPSSGIVDSHALMLSLLGDAENHSATLACKSAVLNGAVRDDGIALEVGGDSSIAVVAKTVINCAGLHAQQVAARIAGLAPEFIPEAVYAKGSYFSLSGRSPFERLIYPVPEPGGLGVHLTLDLGGQAKFGPDVEWVDHIDYQVDPARVDAFVGQVRKYWPGLPDNALQPAYAGIRPKLRTRNGRSADFVISGPAEHGVAGLFNLFGIESPGLTSALALGELVAVKVAGSTHHA